MIHVKTSLCKQEPTEHTYVRFLFPDSISVSVISTENSIANSNLLNMQMNAPSSLCWPSRSPLTAQMKLLIFLTNMTIDDRAKMLPEGKDKLWNFSFGLFFNPSTQFTFILQTGHTYINPYLLNPCTWTTPKWYMINTTSTQTSFCSAKQSYDR
jgi:hypothetical protein